MPRFQIIPFLCLTATLAAAPLPMTLEWDPYEDAANADGLVIEKNTYGFGWGEVARIPVDQTDWTDHLTGGVFEYRVRAFKLTGDHTPPGPFDPPPTLLEMLGASLDGEALFSEPSNTVEVRVVQIEHFCTTDLGTKTLMSVDYRMEKPREFFESKITLP